MRPCALVQSLVLCFALAGCQLTPSGKVQLHAGDGQWVFSDPGAFRRDGSQIELRGKSAYRPPHRSPRALALLGDWEFGDFDLDAELLQTGREYGHRDLCLVFGFVDPAHYFYVHLASKADAHAHSIFVVDGTARRSIASWRTEGIDWGRDRWHLVRLRREGARIEVYFDDMQEPVMRAEDPRFARGRIGFGSFDDTGKMRRMQVRAADPRRCALPAFSH